MEKDIKIQDKTFTFKLPELMENSVSNHLADWVNLINEQNNPNEVWTTIPELANYQFKNLKIVSDDGFETDNNNNINLNVSFRYDEVKNNNII